VQDPRSAVRLVRAARSDRNHPHLVPCKCPAQTSGCSRGMCAAAHGLQICPTPASHRNYGTIGTEPRSVSICGSYWLWAQSRAIRSRPNFPDNREETGNFELSLPSMSHRGSNL
jgi:hypothetical protein